MYGLAKEDCGNPRLNILNLYAGSTEFFPKLQCSFTEFYDEPNQTLLAAETGWHRLRY